MPRKPQQFVDHPISFERAQEIGFYRASVEHIVDGDTWDLLVDLGFGSYAYIPVRLVRNPGSRFDVYERGTPKGDQATQFCKEEFLHKSVLVRSYRDGQTFERWLAQVFIVVNDDLSLGRNVCNILSEGGFEKP